MDKEKDYIEYLIKKKQELKIQIAEIINQNDYIDLKLEENMVCPWCFKKLEIIKFADASLLSCTKCDYENVYKVDGIS